MNVKMNPKVLLEAMCADADPRKVRSLRLIYAICEEQRDRGSKDYSIATIGRLSVERDGPAAGAIRNKTGETYRALIKAFAASVDGKGRRTAAVNLTQADLILEGVTDPVLRTRIGLLVAELKSTRAQLLAARHLANRNAVLDMGQQPRDEVALQNAAMSGEIEVLPPTPRLSPLQVRALENAISEVTLTHWGWRVDAGGRIVTDTGQTVFGPGFATAIRKMLESIPSGGK
jgi:hypothetical protein